MPPGAHSRLGASKSKRWMTCPGSVALEDGLEDKPSIYALEGTAAHDLGERCLRQGKNAHEWIGKHILVEKDGAREVFTVDDEMADAVQEYVDYVRGLAEAEGGEAPRMLIEHEFDLGALKPPEPMFGTSDCTLWFETSGHLRVIDYKHGRGVAVDAVGNTQGLQYALGAVVDLRVKPSTITIAIVQPRAAHPDGPIREWDVSWEELVAFKKDLMAKAEATQDPNAPLVPGDHCRFCRALAVCPEQRKNAESLAVMEFADDVVVLDGPPPADQLPIPDLVNILQQAATVRAWLNAVEAHALQILESGGEVPGFKLVRGTKHRQWTDVEAADKLLARRGLKVKDRFKKTLLTPAQAEKKLPKDKELLAKYITKPEGAPTLAPADDARPEIENPLEAFEVLAP